MLRKKTVILPSVLGVALVMLLAFRVFAPSVQAGPVLYMVDDAFIRETPARVTAGYVIIHNPTEQEDRLVGIGFADSDRWAGRAELHTVTKDDQGVLKMQPVDAMILPAEGVLELRPGGKHMMFFDVAMPLKTDDLKTIVLKFEKAGQLPVTVTVRDMSYSGKDGQKAIPADAIIPEGIKVPPMHDAATHAHH